MRVVEKLPESVTLSDGLVLKHRFKNFDGAEKLAREQGCKFRLIGVRQKGKRVDHLGEPIKPTEWIFTDKEIDRIFDDPLPPTDMEELPEYATGSQG